MRAGRAQSGRTRTGQAVPTPTPAADCDPCDRSRDDMTKHDVSATTALLLLPLGESALWHSAVPSPAAILRGNRYVSRGRDACAGTGEEARPRQLARGPVDGSHHGRTGGGGGRALSSKSAGRGRPLAAVCSGPLCMATPARGGRSHSGETPDRRRSATGCDRRAVPPQPASVSTCAKKRGRQQRGIRGTRGARGDSRGRGDRGERARRVGRCCGRARASSDWEGRSGVERSGRPRRRRERRERREGARGTRGSRGQKGERRRKEEGGGGGGKEGARRERPKRTTGANAS